MNTQAATQSNGAIRSVVTKENIAMFKKIAIAASAISAVAVLGFGIAGSTRFAHAEPQNEPLTRASAAVQVLRDYPFPGDPHDAVASFNQLVAEISGDAPSFVVAAVIRNFPMPGDPHDAAYSLSELVNEVQRGEINLPVLSETPDGVQDIASVPGGYLFLDVGAWDDTYIKWPVSQSIVPMPGDAHDAAVQLAEFYESLQPATPSYIRVSD